MKKIYMSPAMDVIEMKKQTLLAGSLPSGGSTDQNLAPELDSDLFITDEVLDIEL